MLISIIIPVFNSEETIRSAIKSVLIQEYPFLELIVVDGKSSDRTLKIVKEYADDISVLISENDNGYADAFNKGIRASNGEFVLMLAADDRLLPGAISQFTKTILPETDIWCGSVILRMSYGYLIRKSNPNLSELLNTCSLENAATFYRKSVFNKFGYFNTSYKCANDREMFLKLYTNNARFQVESSSIALFDMGGLSTANPEKYALPEDEMISLKYGIDQNKIKANTKKIRRSLQTQKLIEPIKIFLFKIGIISFIYFILGKEGTYLTKKEMLSLNVPKDWLS